MPTLEHLSLINSCAAEPTGPSTDEAISATDLALVSADAQILVLVILVHHGLSARVPHQSHKHVAPPILQTRRV